MKEACELANRAEYSESGPVAHRDKQIARRKELYTAEGREYYQEICWCRMMRR